MSNYKSAKCYSSSHATKGTIRKYEMISSARTDSWFPDKHFIRPIMTRAMSYTRGY